MWNLILESFLPINSETVLKTEKRCVFLFVCFLGFFFFNIVNTLASGVATGKFNVILIPRLFSVTFFLLQKILESFYPRYNETSPLG